MFLPPIQTPDLTLPANATAVATTNARGVQIYSCDAAPAGQTATYQWVFQSPEATLVLPGTTDPVATHAAGPTWTWTDGSAITGKVLQKSPSPIPDAIPWLLLEAHAVPGAPTGTLTPVAFVRRADTQGGAAPATGCGPTQAGTIIRVPYVATYTFYRAGS